MGSRGGGILHFCPAQVRPNLQCCLQLWGPSTGRMWGCWEPVQRRPQDDQKDGASLCYEERLRIGIVQPGEELWCDLTVALQDLKGANKKDGERLFTRTRSDRTRENGFSLRQNRFRSDIGKKPFPVRVVRHRHRLPRAAVVAPFLEAFKARLDGARRTPIQWFPYPWQGVEQDHLYGAFQPQTTLLFTSKDYCCQLLLRYFIYRTQRAVKKQRSVRCCSGVTL